MSSSSVGGGGEFFFPLELEWHNVRVINFLIGLCKVFAPKQLITVSMKVEWAEVVPDFKKIIFKVGLEHKIKFSC